MALLISASVSDVIVSCAFVWSMVLVGVGVAGVADAVFVALLLVLAVAAGLRRHVVIDVDDSA